MFKNWFRGKDKNVIEVDVKAQIAAIVAEVSGDVISTKEQKKLTELFLKEFDTNALEGLVLEHVQGILLYNFQQMAHIYLEEEVKEDTK